MSDSDIRDNSNIAPDFAALIRATAHAESVIRHQLFVLPPTPFCSQRTNRSRENQHAAVLNNAFASCSRSKRSPNGAEATSGLRLSAVTRPALPADLPGAQVKSCRATCGKTTRRANHLKPVQTSCQKYFAFVVGQISGLTPLVSPDERGVAHVTNARWDAVDAGGARDARARRVR